MGGSPANLTADKAAERVLRLLRSRQPQDTSEAEEIVRGLGPSALPVMTLVVRQCGRSWRMGRALILASGICVVAALMGPIGTGLGVLLWAAAAIAAACLDACIRSKVQPDLIDRAAGMLDALEAPAALDILADALWMGGPRARATVARQVARVLSRLAAEGAQPIAADVRLRLYRALRADHASSSRTPLQQARDFHPDAFRTYDSAVVQFCGRSDDTLALPYLEPLAAGREHVKLTAEARACVAHLREVAARQAEAASLLRPAEAPGNETLLRPAAAAGVGGTPPEHLLRAAASDEAAPDDRPAPGCSSAVQ